MCMGSENTRPRTARGATHPCVRRVLANDMCGLPPTTTTRFKDWGQSTHSIHFLLTLCVCVCVWFVVIMSRQTTKAKRALRFTWWFLVVGSFFATPRPSSSQRTGWGGVRYRYRSRGVWVKRTGVRVIGKGGGVHRHHTIVCLSFFWWIGSWRSIPWWIICRVRVRDTHTHTHTHT